MRVGQPRRGGSRIEAAAFRLGATRALAEFTTARSQILNQRPGLVDC